MERNHLQNYCQAAHDAVKELNSLDWHEGILRKLQIVQRAIEKGVGGSTAVTGVELIAKERQRQILQEGWTSEHDAHHNHNELLNAAISYALHVVAPVPGPPFTWPNNMGPWKPTPGDPVRQLAKAGALIAAEIDRLNRLAC